MIMHMPESNMHWLNAEIKGVYIVVINVRIVKQVEGYFDFKLALMCWFEP